MKIIETYYKYLCTIIAMIVMSVAVYGQGDRGPNRITLQGQVLDSITGEPLDFVNIAEQGTTNGTITDLQGNFSMIVKPGSTIQFSFLGYDTRLVKAGKKKMNVVIKMKSQERELTEVVVKPKREHYRRKDNPAVILIRNVIAHKDDYSPVANDYFSETRYDNMKYSLNNFDEGLQEMWGKKFKFIREFVDTALVSGCPVLPISSDERIESHYYRRQGNVNRTVTEAEQHAGVDQMLPENLVALLKTEVFPEMDLNEDNIYLYRKKFVSPLSSFGPAFYKYYILDTLKLEDGNRYIDLGFAPALPQSFGFVGHLYISTDSTFWVKHAELNVPPDINLNFVRNLHVTFENGRLADSTRVTLAKDFYSEMNITASSMGLYAQRAIRYSGFDFNAPNPGVFDLAPVTQSDLLKQNSNSVEYWTMHRPKDGLNEKKSVQALLTRMRRVPLYKYGEKLMTWVCQGFLPADNAKEEDAHFLIGPLNSLASWNSLEHMRFRAGGLSTANLNPHLFVFGYAAYGIEDHKWKGDASLEYSFRKKKLYANEFPIHSVKWESSYDTRNLGAAYAISRDNFMNSFSRSSDPKFTYLQNHGLLYTLEFWNHFSVKLKGEWRREYSSRLGLFSEVGSGINQDHYDMGLATIQLRWAPKESFAQMKTNRIRVDHRHPAFDLTHKIARQGLLGTDFDYQCTEFKFEKRFWMNVLGHADVNIDLGKIWTGNTPYPLLFMPSTNTGYTVEENTFSQLQSMEFVYDQFAHWNVEWRLEGLLFNEIPLVRKLKWREVVGFRGIYGNLSEKNDPEALNADGTLMNPTLYKLPSNGTVYRLGDTPYMEVSVGIMNIFKFFRVEYIRRLTYNDHPGISKNGVQVGAHFGF